LVIIRYGFLKYCFFYTISKL